MTPKLFQASCVMASEAPEILYKYRDLANPHHHRLLESGELYLPRPVDLNDPLECDLSFQWDWVSHDEMIRNFQEREGFSYMDDHNRTSYYGWFDGKPKHYAQQDIQQNWAIVSLTADPLSMLMWSHYGANHTGYCIGFDTLTLSRSIQAPIIFGVGYGNIQPQTHPLKSEHYSRLADQLATKSSVWAYEQEWRFALDRNIPPSRTIELDRLVIRRLYLGARTSELDATRIIQMVKHVIGPHIEIYRCRIERTRYELYSEQIA